MIDLQIKEPFFRTDKEALDWYRKNRWEIAKALEQCDKEIESISNRHNR